MSRRRPRPSREIRMSTLPSCYENLVKTWILRMFDHTTGLRGFITPQGHLDGGIAEYLGLEVSEDSEDFDVAGARRKLQALCERARAKSVGVPKRTALTRNLTWLSKLAGLDEVEQSVLNFRVLSESHHELERSLEMLGQLNTSGVHRILSCVLGHSLTNIQHALRVDGPLITSGLLKFDHHRCYSFSSKLELIPAFADQLCVTHRDPSLIFYSNFTPSPTPLLEESDFPHLNKDIPLLEAYLKEAQIAGKKGINVLIHGSPGTGKTEFGRMVGARLGCKVYEVATQNRDGDPLQGENRFRAYQLAQAVLRGNTNHLMIFDEVEDVFRAPDRGDENPWSRGNRTGIKGWINRILESNTVPSIWVTNALESIDPAFRRRFDFVVEIGVPPRSVRARILDRYLEGMPIDPGLKSRLAEHPGLSPAVVERAAKVVRAASQGGAGLDPDAALSRAIGNTLEALGQPRQIRDSPNSLTQYRPDLLQVDCDLLALKGGLARAGQGRLCFYGPPGTGKSAFARHIAEVLDRPLMVRKTSDLLNPYVGVTERLMAQMFDEAMEDGAVLLLDEADSFLRDRKEARNSWEITHANEMLTQMESFQGIFIASTNLMESIDPASLRRFDAKVHFGYLRSEQAWGMFQQTAGQLGLPIDAGFEYPVRTAGLVTPGDFATLMRQARIHPIQDASDLLSRLKQECKAKPEGRRKAVGF